MAIDVFLPTVVRQAISIEKSGSNVSGTLIPQKDPSGEENRGVKGKPSPTALFVGNAGVSLGVQKPTPPKLATPPFADYLTQEQKPQNQTNNPSGNQTYQAVSPQILSPLAMQEMPPVIAEFLNDIAKQHGVEAPSQQQLQSALRMTSDYRPPKPVIIDTKTAKITILPEQKPSVSKPSESKTPVSKPSEPKIEAPKPPEPQQTASQISGEYSAGFDDLSEDIQKSALDYGRMLEALNRYSVSIQTNN